MSHGICSGRYLRGPVNVILLATELVIYTLFKVNLPLGTFFVHV